MKKLISVLLAVAVLLCICPRDYQIGATEVQPQAETDMESIIREQIEAFAKSIDQKDADDKAAKALAKHGISSGGKKLSVGKNHALTATLMNSNWFQEVLTNSCIKMIETRQIIGQSRVYGRGSCNWAEDKSSYHCSIFDYDFDMNIYKAIIVAANGDLHKTDYCALIKNTLFNESRNAYDSSLFMIVGKVFFSIDLELNQTTKDTEIYDVVLKIIDRFDFHTSNGSGFKDFISGIGALLFKEFDWVATATFELTVPNECEHSYKTKTTKPTCSAKGYTTYTCTLCGCNYKADYTAKLSHKYDNETDGDCNLCGEVRFLRGDMNGDGVLNSSDAVYLLRYSIMPNLYPLSQAADVNGDGTVNSADAVYLLRHTIMPQAYPLK